MKKKIGSDITTLTFLRLHTSYCIDGYLRCLFIQCDRVGRFLIGKAVGSDQFKKPDSVVPIRFRKKGNTVRGKTVLK